MIVSLIINIISLVFTRINFILRYETVTPQKIPFSLFGIIFRGKEEVHNANKPVFKDFKNMQIGN